MERYILDDNEGCKVQKLDLYIYVSSYIGSVFNGARAHASFNMVIMRISIIAVNTVSTRASMTHIARYQPNLSLGLPTQRSE